MRALMTGTLGLMFTLFGATTLSSDDFDSSYQDYGESIHNPPPPMPCSVDLDELTYLELDLVGPNVDFLFWVFEGAQDLPECPGDLQGCNLEALYTIAPDFVPPSQGGEEGPYDFMPHQVGGYMHNLTTCLTKDTNEGIPPELRDSGKSVPVVGKLGE